MGHDGANDPIDEQEVKAVDLDLQNLHVIKLQFLMQTHDI